MYNSKNSKKTNLFICRCARLFVSLSAIKCGSDVQNMKKFCFHALSLQSTFTMFI